MRKVFSAWLLLGMVCASASVLAAELPGHVTYSKQARLGPLVSGTVSKVLVVPGQTVSKGENLLRLDARGYQAELAAANARNAHAQALLKEAEAEFERAEELYERTLLSEVERAQADVALLSAKAVAAEASAARTLAALNVERARLRAPFDGVVVAVDAELGEAFVSTEQSRVAVVVAKRAAMQLRVVADVQPLQAAMSDIGARVRVAGREMTIDNKRVVAEGGQWVLLADFELPADMGDAAGQVGQLVWGQ